MGGGGLDTKVKVVKEIRCVDKEIGCVNKEIEFGHILLGGCVWRNE